MSDDATRLHLEQILELIADITRRTEGMGHAQFVSDRDEVDLTAFRLAAIGEATRKLPPDVRERHTHIPWRAIYDMRNIIAHDYGSIVPDRVWEVLGEPLDMLAEACGLELVNLKN